jgi:hypothetical protein
MKGMQLFYGAFEEWLFYSSFDTSDFNKVHFES